MKSLLLFLMCLLYFGNIAAHAHANEQPLLESVAEIGIRSGLGVALLLLILMLIADSGQQGEWVAVGLGGIVVFAYLTESVQVVTEAVDQLLALGG